MESDTDDTSETPAESPVTTGRTSSRKLLPSSLPRETRRILPSETVCPSCGGGLAEMSASISEQLEILNTAFKFIETVRPKLACCRCDVIAQAPLPPKLVDRSYADPGLLARILVSKYAEHTPLYRQSEIYSRHGFDTEPQHDGTLGQSDGRKTQPVVYSPEALRAIGKQGTH